MRKILLIEPNYKNKYPPIGLMKIATFHRSLGDDVRFFKGNLKSFVVNEIVEECLIRLINVESQINWREKQSQLSEYITKKQNKIYEDCNIHESKNWPLIDENLRYYREIYKNGRYKNYIKWDRIYITTLFTFYWKVTIETINFCKNLVKSKDDIWVGGIMASLIPDEIEKATGIKPFVGLLDKPFQLDKKSQKIVDIQPLDYSILDEVEYEYPFSNAYFGYMTKGCKNKCPFCAVPKLEPVFKSKVPNLRKYNYIKNRFGDKKHLCLMDNNVLASERFEEIINEIVRMGFYKGAIFNEPNELEISINNLKDGVNDRAYKKKTFKILNKHLNRMTGEHAQEYYDILEKYDLLNFHRSTKENMIKAYLEIKPLCDYKRRIKSGLRYVDFNQGIDCRFVTRKKMELMSKIAIRPLRIAFDNLKLEEKYRKAVELAAENGINQFSNYLLYNYKDTPDELYRRLEINMELCEKLDVYIYSFPMKYMPVQGEESKGRAYTGPHWNKKYLDAIQAIINVTKGVVAPPSRGESSDSFFKKAFGRDLKEYHQILYMPETYIIYRKMFEKDLCYTKEWIDAFREIRDTQKFKNIIKIIEEKRFEKVNGNFENDKAYQVLKHYMVTRHDAKKINDNLEKYKTTGNIFKEKKFISDKLQMK